MKFFIMVDGVLVEAKLEHLQDQSMKLFDKKGTEVDRTTLFAKAAEPAGEEPPVVAEETEDKLETAVDQFATNVASAVETIDQKIVDMQKAATAAFPIPDGDTVEVTDDGTNDVMTYLGKHFNLRFQGTSLQDKKRYPNYRVSDENLDALKQYWLLVARASGKRPDPVAVEWLYKLYGDVKTAIGDTGAVFPVPDIVDEEILHYAREASVLLQYARIWPMTSEKQSFPLEGAAVSVGWGNTTSESEPGMSEAELTAQELSAYSAVKNMTLADARSDIVGWLQATLSEAAGQELDNKGFNGVGTDDPFICSGILSAACGYSVALASGSTAFSQVSDTKLSEMIGKLDGLRKEGAMFWLNGAVLHFVRSLKDTNGMPIFIETVGAPMSGTIWGYPYKEAVKCPSTTGANTPFIAFGNMRHFMVGRRLDTSALDVDPYGLWTTNRTRFKLYQRWALLMGLANGFVRLLTAAS